MLSFDEQAVFARYGISAFDLRWTGHPAGGIRVSPLDIITIPFSLLWGGFAIFWEALAIRSHFWPLILWGIPFVALGLFMIFGRFFWDAYVRSKTTYAITNDSALIVQAAPGGGLVRVNLATVSNIKLKVAPNGSGSIIFGDLPMTATASFNQSKSGIAIPAFEYLDRAADVYKIVCAAQRAATSGEPEPK